MKKCACLNKCKRVGEKINLESHEIRNENVERITKVTEPVFVTYLRSLDLNQAESLFRVFDVERKTYRTTQSLCFNKR